MELRDLLNEKQYEAVTSESQYLRIVAGAGSGKTRVLTYRVAYLINECNVAPWRILAITFTNKVAREMKTRVERITNNENLDVNIRTFHAFAAYFLRQEINVLGYPSSFVILDEEDQTKLVKDIASDRGFKRNDKIVKLSLGYISKAKSKELEPDDIVINGRETFEGEKDCLEIYRDYEERKSRMQCLDFDDLLLYTNRILSNFPTIRMKWQNKYDHILIDEFQDTNDIEYKMFSSLMRTDTYLYVVGDPDQTIYTWRGANQRIILDLNERYRDIETIILDRNYRSTQIILNAANSLISYNKMRLKKDLYTEKTSDEPVVAKMLARNSYEADFVAGQIQKLVTLDNYTYSDIAILYRSNYVTQEIEQSLTAKRIPYRIFGGLKFYQRKEIKDLIAYFNLVMNKKDDISFERIINVPRRKIGDSTILAIKKELNGQSFYEYIESVDPEQSEVPSIALHKLKSLVVRIDKTREDINKNEKLFNLYLNDLITDIGYYEYLDNEFKDDAEDRKDNVNALLGDIQAYMNNPEATFTEYLQNIALLSGQDDVTEGNFVSLMTVHTAKGLEFPVVFIIRLNQNVFPSARSLLENGNSGLEEERRLCYVAMTRAMERLYMTYTEDRIFNGGYQDRGEASQFFKESGLVIPKPLSQGMNKNYQYGDYNKRYKNPAFDDLENTYKEQKSGDLYQKHHQNLDNSPKYESNNITWNVGDILIHKSLGRGKVIKVDGDNIIQVEFDNHGIKTILGNHPSVKKGE